MRRVDTGRQLAVSDTVGIVINLCNKCLLRVCSRVVLVIYLSNHHVPIAKSLGLYI